MQLFNQPQRKALLGLGLAVASLLLLAVACGTAATATPAPTRAPSPTAPTVSAGQTPTPKSAPTTVPAPAALAVNPGKLTIMMGDFGEERFDYAFTIGSPGSRNYGRMVVGFLMSTNDKTEMVPGIASQWSLSADGLTSTFTIRKGVKFHDGSELTPQDVVWTLQHYFDPKAVEYITASSMQVVARITEKVELSGPDKVSVTTTKPRIDLASVLSEGGTGWHGMMPKRASLHDTEVEAAYDRNPIGAGFMKLEKHVPASLMKFQRFDDFYYQPKNGFPEDKRLNFQSLDLFLAPEEATRVAAMRTGEADIVPASLGTKNQVEAGGGRLVFGQEGVSVEAFWAGCYQPQWPCHDKRVRQAFHYAIDKELIRDKLYGGPTVFQVKGWNWVSPSTIGYSPELDPWPFDPAKARQLLADAGYPGGTGFGKVIVNTYPSPAMPLQVEAAQLGAEFWRRELGLDVEVKVVDSVGNRQRYRSGQLNGQIIWRDNGARKDAASGIANSYADPKSDNRVHEDPELFRLVQETLGILNPDQQAEALKKLYLRLRDESHVMGVGYANIPWGVGPRVLTWRPYAVAPWPSALHTVTLK
jgi:peptide/nickel transport system substrate-binding protein